MTHPFELTIARSDGAANIYLEVAARGHHVPGGRPLRRGPGQAPLRGRARALLDLGAKDVAVLRDGRETRVPIDRLAVGDRFVVRPGEKIATDGVVTRALGGRRLDAHRRVRAGGGPAGDAVVGATVNAGGRLVVRATRIGTDTRLAQMATLVEAAQNGKAEVQRLADRVSAVFVPIVIALAAATLAFWLGAGGGAAAAFTAAVAVLIVACPCALGLATPTALLVGTGRGAQLGILIKGPEVLESTRRVDTVVLDKTGTVTSGRMAVVGVHPAAGVDATAVLRLAGALENASEHPIARAIAAGPRPGGGLPASRTSPTGRASACGRRRRHACSSAARRCWSSGASAPAELAARPRSRGGAHPVAVAGRRAPRRSCRRADTVKPTSAEAVGTAARTGPDPGDCSPATTPPWPGRWPPRSASTPGRTP
jgi:Cu+-exporting ATPase